jgi:hypothetical protein
VLTLSYSDDSSCVFGASGGGGGLRDGLGAGRALGTAEGDDDGTPGRGGPGRGIAAAGAVDGVGAGFAALVPAPAPHAGVCGGRTGMVGFLDPGMYCGAPEPSAGDGGRDAGGATDGAFGPPPTGTRAPGGAEYPGRCDAEAGGCDGVARGAVLGVGAAFGIFGAIIPAGAPIGRDEGIGEVGAFASAGLAFACGTKGCFGGGASIVGRSSTSSCGSFGATFGGGGVDPIRFFAVHVGQRIGPRIVSGGRGICVPQPLQRIATPRTIPHCHVRVPLQRRATQP